MIIENDKMTFIIFGIENMKKESDCYTLARDDANTEWGYKSSPMSQVFLSLVASDLF